MSETRTSHYKYGVRYRAHWNQDEQLVDAFEHIKTDTEALALIDEQYRPQHPEATLVRAKVEVVTTVGEFTTAPVECLVCGEETTEPVPARHKDHPGETPDDFCPTCFGSRTSYLVRVDEF